MPEARQLSDAWTCGRRRSCTNRSLTSLDNLATFANRQTLPPPLHTPAKQPQPPETKVQQITEGQQPKGVLQDLILEPIDPDEPPHTQADTQRHGQKHLAQPSTVIQQESKERQHCPMRQHGAAVSARAYKTSRATPAQLM